MSPTIFVILVADVGLWPDAKIFGYADDTTATISGPNLGELSKRCEEEAEKIIEFMSANRLAANSEKTHIMAIRKGGKKSDIAVKVGQKMIKESPDEKLLGMKVESNLSWNTHISTLEKKLRHRLFSLRRLSEHIPRHLLKNVADGIFMSVLRYGLPLYCPLRLKSEDPNCASIHKIKMIFNDCLRLLTNRKRKDHVKVEDMLKELQWLSINQMCAETRLLEAWKTTNINDYCMQDIMKEKEKSNYMSTRSNDHHLFKTCPSDKFTNRSFAQRTAQIWNVAPKTIKEARSLSSAKSAIRTFVKNLPI